MDWAEVGIVALTTNHNLLLLKALSKPRRARIRWESAGNDISSRVTEPAMRLHKKTQHVPASGFLAWLRQALPLVTGVAHLTDQGVTCNSSRCWLSAFTCSEMPRQDTFTALCVRRACRLQSARG